MGNEEEEELEAVTAVVGVFFSVLGAATAAGLTMGLMSLDSLDLLVLVESDPQDCVDDEEREELEEEKKNASVLLPLLEDHHRLLVTLLLLNSLCAEALPIFLDELVPSSVAVLLGVFFLLVFGEILPSAVFTGPAGMKTAARFAPLVRFFLLIFSPVAIPTGRFLDWWVGDEEEKVYNRSELLALLRIHSGKSAGKLLTVKQSRMMQGAMDLVHVTAKEVMTPIDKMFMLSTETELNLPMMAEIVGKGYSRIPVFDKANRHKIKGMLLTKSLAVVNPSDNIPVGNLFARPCGCVSPDTALYEVLAMMRATKSHMCLVTDDPAKLSKYMQRQAGSFIPRDPEGSVLGQGTNLSSSSEVSWKVFGCLSLHDIVAVVVAGDIADEYSSRRQPKLHPSFAHEDSDFSDNDEEAGPSRPRSTDTNSTPHHKRYLNGVEPTPQHIEFKSQFAKDKVMRWVERAKLTTRLHHEQIEAAKQKADRQLSATESTPLVSSSAATASAAVGPDHSAKSSAVARRLLSAWLLKKASPTAVTKSEVDSALHHVSGPTRKASANTLALVTRPSGSSLTSQGGGKGKVIVQPPASDSESEY